MGNISNREKIIDLTSLLDVVLILLFGLLVTLSLEKEDVQGQMDALENIVYQAELEKEYLEKEAMELKAYLSEQFNYEDPVKILKQQDVMVRQFMVVDVRIDTDSKHEVVINEQPIRVFLPLSIRNDNQALEEARKDIYNALEKVILEERVQGQYILLSLEDRGGTYNYAFNLVWNVFREIEESQQFQQIHKMQYIQY